MTIIPGFIVPQKEDLNHTGIFRRWNEDHDPERYPVYPTWGRTRDGGDNAHPNFRYFTNFECAVYRISFEWSWATDDTCNLGVARFIRDDEVESITLMTGWSAAIKEARTQWITRLPAMLVITVL